MFSWCAYCQHLIGEVPPLQDFRITHGICEGCMAQVTEQLETYAPTTDVLQAKTLFESLQEAGRSSDFSVCSAAIDSAFEAGLKPSEVMIGVLHPALARIGQLWESGEITVTEEHRFTDFALQLIDRLRFPQSLERRPLVLLVTYPENAHEVGLRMLQILTWDQSIPCERLPAGTSAELIAEAIATQRPDLVGLSVSLVESIPGALILAEELSRLLPPTADLVLGGQAFRRDDTPDLSPSHKILPTVDDYVARLQDLHRKWADRASTNGPDSAGHSS